MNTPSPLRSFLDQMKQQSSAEKARGANGKRPYFVEPMYMRFMGNTGNGEDGRLQTGNPVAIYPSANGPTVVHEGEDLYANPNGDMNVMPARMSQGRMRYMEKTMNLPGRQEGGTIRRDPRDTIAEPQTAARAVVPRNVQTPSPTAINITPAAEAATPRIANTVTAAEEPRIAKTVTAPAQVNITPPPTELAIKPPTAAATGTPAATGATYMQNAMSRLNEIMQGGSPALRAIQDRQLQTLKAQQGMQQRVQGFEAAQAGLSPETTAAGRAMSRAVAGSQLAGAQAEMAGAEMQQREQAARDLASLSPTMQQMEQSGRNEISNLIGLGFSKEQIKAQTGVDLSDDDYQRMLYSTPRGQNQINAAASAGDWKSVNNWLQTSGLKPIDFSKVEAGESRQAITDIDNLINSLGDDADPKVVAALSGMKASILGKAWSTLGIDTANQTLTNTDGTKVSVADLLKNIDTPTDAATVQTIAKISSSTEDFLNTPDGDIVMEQLSATPAWTALYDKAKGGDDAAAQEMGRILGAAMTLEAYIQNPSTSRPPSATQKTLLEKYGIWREATPDTATSNAKSAAIQDKISGGDLAGAQKLYDQLSASEKQSIGTFEELSAPALRQSATQINTAKNYDTLIGKKLDDPLVLEVMKGMLATTLTYNNKSGKNDEIAGAPAVGTWIRYKTPDGEKLLKVTYNGHLNTAGTSDRAYMEFQDIEGNTYSTSGNTTTLMKGVNTKYKKK